MQNNLTKGSVFKNLIVFSLPYLLSSFLQTFYGMADLFIVGQYNGADSSSAVSIGSQVMHMVTLVIVGLAMGSTVMISQSVGAGNDKRAARAIGNTVTIFLIVSLVMTAALLFLRWHSVRNVNAGQGDCPDENVSHDLLRGNPFYHCIQYYKLYSQGTGRLKKSHVFCCSCMCV